MPTRSVQKLNRLIRARCRAAHAGRPKATGPRYASGDLKPRGPNEVVVEHRRILLGQPHARGMRLRHAENALDLMLYRGWITRQLHETANAYRRLYLAAFPALPDLKTTRVDEAPTDQPLERLSRSPTLPNPDGNPAAMNMLRAVWRVLELRPASRTELIELCLLSGAWPTWLTAMIEGRALSQAERKARAAFYQGLHIVGQVLARPGLAQMRAVA